MPGEPLTERELDVLRLIARGLTNPGIARLLGISLNTAKDHTRHIYAKLGVASRAEAATWYALHYGEPA